MPEGFGAGRTGMGTKVWIPRFPGSLYQWLTLENTARHSDECSQYWEGGGTGKSLELVG